MIDRGLVVGRLAQESEGCQEKNVRKWREGDARYWSGKKVYLNRCMSSPMRVPSGIE